MLMLRFQVGRAHYVLEICHVVEVLPFVDVTPIPRAPAAVAGVFSYHGSPVPAIDLSRLMTDQPASRRLSTRLALVRYPRRGADAHLLGLIAERMTEIEAWDQSAFSPPGVTSVEAPYLGPVAADARGLVQAINLAALLPPGVDEVLFNEPADVPCSSPTSINS
jgi:chemotaxis-related protein WspB